jgi:hypothetical protein
MYDIIKERSEMTELSVGHPTPKYIHQSTEPKPIRKKEREVAPKNIAPTQS